MSEQANKKFTADQLKNKTALLTVQFPIDIDKETDWIDEIKDRVGDIELTEEQLVEFIKNELLEGDFVDIKELINDATITLE